jgi:chromosome segregation ATPase
MSEQTQADRPQLTPLIHDGSLEPSSRFVPLADGRVARFDTSESIAEPAETTTTLAEFSNEPPQRHGELLSQASLFVDQLRVQVSELQRRDQILATQFQQLDQERRGLRQWKQEADHELQSTAEVLRQREATLAAQVASQQTLIEQLRSEQTDLTHRREQLEADRLRLLAEVGTKVAAERERLQQAIAATDVDRQCLQMEFDRQRQFLEQTYQTKLQEVEAAKSRVRQDITEEVLTAQLRAERESLLRERDELDQARSEFMVQRDRERAELDHARQIHEASVARVREELLAQQQTQLAALDAAKNTQEAELQQAQEAFARQREQQLTELRHERAVLENRLRFQQEHLAKARQEIESAHNEFRCEAQRARGQLEEGDTIIRLRQSQLDRVRSLLEERERSVNREREMLIKSQRAFEQFTEHDRERIKLEREEWDRERGGQLADLRRQQDMLALHAQNLEGRRERLDNLRAELEETHRTTLERRMAIEEAWAQMTQACGTEMAQQRLDQAQQQLSGHYRGLRDALIEQRRELDEMRQVLQTQRDELRAEQQTLSEWAATQERTLRARESDLQTQAEQLNVRESAWRSASQRWINEKIEAEAVIRDLLEQLTSLTEPTSPVSMWPRPAMPVYE